MTSEVSARAKKLVAHRTPTAVRLGRRLAGLVDDPEAFGVTLERGLTQLADAAYGRELARVSPGLDCVGVRQPLLAALGRSLASSLGDASPASLVSIAQRLARARALEVRLVALPLLRMSLRSDPERSWQVLRRLAGSASDWILVDSLAGVVGEGILIEPRRWAELEQLVYSPSPWERRLVGATLATLPRLADPSAYPQLRSVPALALIATLLGDDSREVQKALSWALRSWRGVDPEGVSALLRREATQAAEQRDGHRAWVLRDALEGGPEEVSAPIRRVLHGVRRHAQAGSTSQAGQIARSFRAAPELQEAGLVAARQSGGRMEALAR